MKKRIFSFLLALALLLTTFAAFGMDGAAADSARDVQLSEGVRNIVKRAYQMTDIQWTPQADVLGWNGDLTYRAGVTYTGLPYGQPVYAAYVPWVTDLDGFAAAVNDPNSRMYTSYSTYNCRAPYYSCDCSAFVSLGVGTWRQTDDEDHRQLCDRDQHDLLRKCAGRRLPLSGRHPRGADHSAHI